MYKSLIYPQTPAYVYCVLAAGVYLLLANYQSFTAIRPLKRSTAVPEKISF